MVFVGYSGRFCGEVAMTCKGLLAASRERERERDGTYRSERETAKGFGMPDNGGCGGASLNGAGGDLKESYVNGSWATGYALQCVIRLWVTFGPCHLLFHYVRFEVPSGCETLFTMYIYN